MPDDFSFRLTATDGAARTGEIATPHGIVRTPAFMPVGTQAAIKGVHHDDVRKGGADIMLANTYHLMLRPSAERVAALGGLHTFMRWPYPIITDSGGFQVMSLANLRKVGEEGVTFRSHLDGAMIALTPERAVEVQILLGSDIAMQLDECVRLPAERSEIERAMKFRYAGPSAASARSRRRNRPSAVRHRAGRRRSKFARGERACACRYRLPRLCARRPCRRRNPGRDAQGRWRDRADAAGRQAALSHGCRHAGRSSRGIARGIDMFDCVMPTRNGRHGLAFTRFGPINIKNAHHGEDPRPLDDESRCPAARDFSRAYLHHLFRAGEALGGTLLSIVNLYYYQDLMAGARAAIAAGRFADYLAQTREQWAAKGDRRES